MGEPDPFDAIVLAGNVMVFIAPGTEADVLRRCAAHLTTDGFIVTGFHTNRDLALADFDQSIVDAGLRVEHRFATWDLRAWHPDGRLRRVGPPPAVAPRAPPDPTPSRARFARAMLLA